VTTTWGSASAFPKSGNRAQQDQSGQRLSLSSAPEPE
jgi:hypothetical protein